MVRRFLFEFGCVPARFFVAGLPIMVLHGHGTLRAVFLGVFLIAVVLGTLRLLRASCRHRVGWRTSFIRLHFVLWLASTLFFSWVWASQGLGARHLYAVSALLAADLLVGVSSAWYYQCGALYDKEKVPDI